MAKNSTSFVNDSSSHGVCFLSVPFFDPNNMNPPGSVYPTWTFLATVNGIASLPTAVLNGLIIWTVFWDETIRSSTFNLLLGLLAVTDFLVGLLVEPIFCVLLGCFVKGCHSPCQFTMHALLMLPCCGITMVILVAASVERYLAIQHPNFYLKHVTGKRVIVTTIMTCVSTFTCLMASSAFLNKNHPSLTRVPIMIVTSVSALVILYCSVKVQLTAYRQSKTIAQQQASVQQADEQQQQEQRLKEYKKGLVMTILVGLMVVFYIPFMIVAAIEAVGGKDVTREFKYLSSPVCITFLQLQSLINPIIMTLRLSYIRQGIKNKLSFFTGN
ncbi:histamine H2 receptor [Exaiptasia diaphana]|uniref:G-protein coupled receptors family 1 profile domain-containing protein n=1 Tax=Exaiptasia diaphana TaxID=2652724 RepID=A0A913XQB7_EXADI|nr:histamine H2 receptor [Exaiptasia diaphana]